VALARAATGCVPPAVDAGAIAAGGVNPLAKPCRRACEGRVDAIRSGIAIPVNREPAAEG
jgi:hypothetical protein